MRAPLVVLAVAVVACSGCRAPGRGSDPLDAVADEYVRLVLAVGRHDPGYVDAYYGPPEWKEEAARGEPRPVADLLRAATELRARAEAAPPSDRREFLVKQLAAVEAFVRRLGGERIPLEREARDLYDIEIPRHGIEEFEAARRELEAILPGEGDLAARAQEFQKRFEIPPDRLRAVVDACLGEARRRTAALCELPAGESFRVSIVRDKPWGAYNWYEGGLSSLIEVNTDLPLSLARVFGLLVHEGYPGHHTMNILLEDRLVRGRGWREFSVYPLYSPTSVIAEGTANVGEEIVATRAERVAFARDVLAPLAGLEGLDFETMEKARDAWRVLGHARGEAARMLLDEGEPEDEVVAFLMRHGLLEEPRARKAVEFMRAYGAYEFAYTVGEDLVRAHIGNGPDRVERFFALLDRPVTPSMLRRSGEAEGPAGPASRSDRRDP